MVKNSVGTKLKKRRRKWTFKSWRKWGKSWVKEILKLGTKIDQGPR